jgi:WD40 repeat protein
MSGDGDVTADYAVRAAVMSMFEAEWLARRPLGETALKELLAFVAANCYRVLADDGTGRWRLDDLARRRVFRTMSEQRLLLELESLRTRPTDPLQRLLERYLRGEPIVLDDLDADGVANTRQLVDWFGERERLPSEAALDRRGELLELRAPLARLSGRPFVGRGDLLDALRGFVRGDERSRFVIHGVGGVGKSTVVARFLLEQAEDHPFAYLSCDRGWLIDSGPVAVFDELASQLALQLGERRESFDALRERAASRASGRRQLGDVASRVAPGREQVDLRSIAELRDLLTGVDRVILVLDAFEEVQRRDVSYERELVGFLDLLEERIPGLRVILAGRVPVRVGEPLGFELRDLTDDEARALLELLTAGTDVDPAEFGGALAVAGRNPLSVRLAGDILRRAKGPARLVAVAEGEIQGYLYGRLLEHIPDRRARLVAHPGLVVRRLTPDVIAAVLAEPCGLGPLSAGEAEEIFAELGREATLCEPSPEGALLHREDVRRAMLPAIQRDRPRTVTEIHERAVRYYERRTDTISRTEELYHRLMLQQPTDVLDERWREDAADELARLIDELPARSQVYLSSRVPDLPLADELLTRAAQQQWAAAAEPRARARLERGQYDDALELVRARRGDGGVPLLPALEVEALERSGRLDEALAVARRSRAAATRRGWVDVIRQLVPHEARLLERLRRWDEASALLRELREINRERRLTRAPSEQEALDDLVALTSLLRISRHAGARSDRLADASPGAGPTAEARTPADGDPVGGDPVMGGDQVVGVGLAADAGLVAETVGLALSVAPAPLATSPSLLRDVLGEIAYQSRPQAIRLVEAVGGPASVAELGLAEYFPSPERGDVADPMGRLLAGLTTAADAANGLGYGDVRDRYMHGFYESLRDVSVSMDSLPADLRLRNPADPNDLLGFFTGRGWLLARLDRYIGRCVERETGMYLVITADPGTGKTALSTYLAFARAWPTHVTRSGVVDPKMVRLNLAAQLIARWGLHEFAADERLGPGGVPTTFLDTVLAAAARRRDAAEARTGQREAIVLVVDGLQDAPPVGPGQLPFGLPLSLPPGTVVVATSRAGMTVAQNKQVVVASIGLEPDSDHNREDLRAHLRRVAAAYPPAYGPRLPDGGLTAICDVLVEQSAGVWVYALAVLEQLGDWSGPADEVTRLPSSLNTFYAITLDRWRREQPDWADVGLPLLATLAAAREPLGRAVLADWAEISAAAAKRWLAGVLDPFLSVRRGADRSTYALFHGTLREFVGGAPAPAPRGDGDELTRTLTGAAWAAHDRIALALTRGDEPGWPGLRRYRQRHLPEHAAACGRLDDVVGDPEFLLGADLSKVQRLRWALRTSRGRSAVAALDLAARSWSADREDRLRWLEVCARKVRNDRLADASRALLPGGWRPVAAAWWGGSHRVLSGSTQWVKALAVVPRPDGSHWIASGGTDAVVRVWDAQKPADPWELAGHTGTVEALAPVLLPDRRSLLASAGSDGTVRTWDPQTGQQVAEFHGHRGGVWALTALPHLERSTLVASAGADGTVQTWDPVTGGLVWGRSAHSGAVRALTVVPTDDPGQTWLVSAGADGLVRVWRSEAGQPVSTFAGHSGMVEHLAVVPWHDRPCLVASAGRDGVVWLWDPATGRSVSRYSGLGSPIRALAVLSTPTRSWRLASADRAGRLRVWDLGRAAAGPEEQLGTHLKEDVRALVAVPRPDGSSELASAGSTGAIRLWEPQELRLTEVARMDGHVGAVESLVTILRQEEDAVQIASAGGDGRVRLWDPRAVDVYPGQGGHAGGVAAMTAIPAALGSGPLVATGGWDRSIRLWDARDGSAVLTLIGYGGGADRAGQADAVTLMELVPGRRGEIGVLASCGVDGAVHLTNLARALRSAAENGLLLDRRRAPSLDLRGLREAGAMIEPEILAGRLRDREGDRVTAMTVVPRPDGRHWLATASAGGAVDLWDPWRAAWLGKLWTRDGAVASLAAFTGRGGGAYLAAAGRAGVQIWDVATRTLVGLLAGSANPATLLTTVARPGGGSLLVTSGGEPVVQVWDPDTGRRTHTLDGHEDAVTATVSAARPGRAVLATGSLDQTVRLWDLERGGALATLRGHSDAVSALKVLPLPDGGFRIASGGWDESIRVWDAEGGMVARLMGHTAAITALTAAPTPDGATTLVSAADDSSLVFWSEPF